MASAKLKKCMSVCGCCSCCTVIFWPWMALLVITFHSLANQPTFCVSSKSKIEAAADARPDVYSSDGTIKWNSVVAGWNVACGEKPDTSQYGQGDIIEDDSGFKNNSWSPFMFKLMPVVAMKEVSGYPYGSRLQSVERVGKMFSINLFYMPTATAENVIWMDLQYEVCAYFKGTNGSLPKFRLYKTTKSPLGASDPFVQELVGSSGGEVHYHAISKGYNDDGPEVGKGHFIAKEATECSVWSNFTEGAFPGIALTVLFSTFLLFFTVAFGVCCKKFRQNGQF